MPGQYDLEDDSGPILLNDLTDYYELGEAPTPSAGPTWWDGAIRQPMTLRGWWDGAVEQPVTLRGWWNGSSIDPLI